MRRDVTRTNDVHVRVGRLVVDRAALGDGSERGLHDIVADRIAHRLHSGDAADDAEPASRTGLSDVIATAVAAHVSPRLTLARRR